MISEAIVTPTLIKTAPWQLETQPKDRQTGEWEKTGQKRRQTKNRGGSVWAGPCLAGGREDRRHGKELTLLD